RWYPVGAGNISMSESDAAARFREFLADSVRLHLRSDVPVGSCLSGGLDSSSIVSLMAGLLRGSKINTVSACYTGYSVDETSFVKAVVDHVGTVAHFVYPRADDVLRMASDVTWYQDEPFGSTSIYAQWCVFEQAKRIGIKVMLDGQGADEQLAGYHASFHYYLSSLARNGHWLMLARTMGERWRLHGVPSGEQL